MTVHANSDNPRVVTLTFATTATPTTCVACGTEVDPNEFYALATGPGDRVADASDGTRRPGSRPRQLRHVCRERRLDQLQ
jgi:hypothetical protein